MDATKYRFDEVFDEIQKKSKIEFFEKKELEHRFAGVRISSTSLLEAKGIEHEVLKEEGNVREI